MSHRPYFSTPLPLNADLARHRKHIKKLEADLASAQAMSDDDPFKKAEVTAYGNFLRLCRDSYARLAMQIGKK